MTDNEIIKALEYCMYDDYDYCKECMYRENKPCQENLIRDALCLINRQKAEIERLRYNLKAVLDERADHSDAINEFAERLKENKIDIDVSFGYGREVYTEAVAVIEIDNLVKEMVGEDNG